MPTSLDLAGVAAPGAEFAGRPVWPVTGISMTPLLDGTTASPRQPDEVVADETFGTRFVSEGHFKALLLPRPFGTGDWQLYDLAADPSESVDLAPSRPTDLARRRAHWDQYAMRNRIILPDWVSGY